MGGRATTTQKSTTAPAPEAMEYYKLLMKKLRGIDKLGYTPYEGKRVAEFTPYQQMAMKSVEDLKGAGMGTLQEALEAGRRGTAPITTADIQRYQNPYETMLVDAMSQQMRQQEAEDISKLQGTSISRGAFGGDRSKMAQAQMMRDQERERNSRIAELKYKGYSDSVAAAQADREAAARGSSLLSQLATQEYNQPMSWVRDLYGMGASQQALEQQKLNIPYETYLERRAFPYQQLQYLSGLGTGIGSQMGGTSYGETTQPKPSTLSQLGGLGLSLALAPMTGGASLAGAALGSFLPKPAASGGRVEKAEGGGLGETAMFQEGFIPVVNPVKGQGAPGFSTPIASEQGGGASDMIEQAMSLAKKIKGPSDPTDSASWQTTTTLSPENTASWATSINPVQSMSPMSPSMLFPTSGFAHGGSVDIPHYDNGGGTVPSIISAYKTLAGLSTPKEDEEENKSEPDIVSGYRVLANPPKPKPVIPDWKTTVTPSPVVTTEAVKEEPLPEINVPQEEQKVGIGKVLSKEQNTPSLGITSPVSETQKGSSFLGSLLGLSPEAEQAGMLAGLAIAAGQSPYALSNIGAGGMSGMKYYNDLIRAKQEQALKEKELSVKAGEKNLVGTRYVTEDGDPVQRDTKTGKFYDKDQNLITESTKIYPDKTLMIPEKAKTNLLSSSKVLDDLSRFENTFNPSFGGKMIKGWGDVQNILGRNLPVSPELRQQAEWWQGYNLFRNQARNTLFGSQLTKTEKEAFDAADISPEQDPEVIKNNLIRQKYAATKALHKLMKAEVTQGYLPKKIEDITEYKIDDLEKAREDLGKKVEEIYRPTETETPKTTESTHPRVSTKKEFDALDKDTIFFNVKKNRLERKP